MHTERLQLVLMRREQILAMVAAMEPNVRAEVSPVWLARVEASTTPDPWTHGFAVVHRDGGVTIGQCAFKGPPDADGAVEIAYGIDPAHRGNGYATEVAEALVDFAFDSGPVRVVRAHTLPDSAASQRVLAKCGFRHVGEVKDPEDGLVWRWEKHRGGRIS